MQAQPRPGGGGGGGGTASAASSGHPPCAHPGNPVFSCMLRGARLSTGTGLSGPQLLLYKTTARDYGALPPTTHTAPCRYFPRDNSLTDHLLACGKTQFNCINTGLDKGRACDHRDIMNLL